MASELVKVEIWVVVDSDGDYALSKDGHDEAGEAYEEECTSLTEATTRRVKITVMVPRPKAVEITATLAEEPDVGTVSVQ